MDKGGSRSRPDRCRLGWPLRHQLARLTHRREHETALASPGQRSWIPLPIAADMAGLVTRCGTAELWPWLLPTAPLAIIGARLAAIDLDVQRLPDKLLSADGGDRHHHPHPLTGNVSGDIIEWERREHRQARVDWLDQTELRVAERPETHNTSQKVVEEGGSTPTR